MIARACNWVDAEDRSSLRYNFYVTAWVICRNGQWRVEIFRWDRTIGGRAASRERGKRGLERWVGKKTDWGVPPYRGRERR